MYWGALITSNGALVAFPVQAAGRCPGLAEIVLAAAAELEPVDHETAIRSLDRLAATLAGARRAVTDSVRECEALASLLGDLLAPRDDGAECLMLDRVLDGGCGHPVLLAVVWTEVAQRTGMAVVWTEVAQRAGMAVAPAGGPGLLLVGHLDADRRSSSTPVGGPLRDWSVSRRNRVAPSSRRRAAERPR